MIISSWTATSATWSGFSIQERQKGSSRPASTDAKKLRPRVYVTLLNLVTQRANVGQIRGDRSPDGLSMLHNDCVERPATLLVPRPDAAHEASRSAPKRC
jgi:hypothetical protein